jgi:hypothetical protein
MIPGVRWFETQQISFYTGTDFYPFIHHVDVKTSFCHRWDATDPAADNLAISIAMLMKK